MDRSKLIPGVLVFFFFLCFSSASLSADVDLTEAERTFLEKHPVIRLGVDPGFVPFEYIDTDGGHKGIAADYARLIEDELDVKFVVSRGLTWPEAYAKAVEGEIDVLSAVSKTPERERHFLFSQPYYNFKRVIVTRDTHKGIRGIEDLYGKTVAVQRNSGHHSYLINYPGINLSLYDSVETALTSVANGTETAFLGNLATTDYLIKSTGLTNLRFVAFEAEKQQSIHFAVRKDWPELVSAIDKVLAVMTQEQKIAINTKWIDLGSGVDYGPIIRMLLAAGAVVALILAVSLCWIWRLNKEVVYRKRVQKDLEQAKQEAEAANNVKSSFMARMSHEVRTPLNAINGMAYLIKKTEITPTQKMYVERIIQASNNMLSIINDILDFSKIEAGKVQLEKIPFNIDNVLQNVIDIVSFKIEEQRIGFHLTKDPKLPNHFFGDPRRIEQILINIINNSAKFTESGTISFDVRMKARKPGSCLVLFTIEDTGIGMSEEQANKLFEPFIQGDASITRRFGGTGLGLSIVKNLVEMMKGEIQVFSVENEGTTFIIQLDLEVDAEKEEEHRNKIASSYFRNIKTLVLEKTGSNMNLIDSYLSSFGMECEITTSEKSAKNLLETANDKFSKPFDLVVIDYDTPEEKGFVFVDRMRTNPRIVKMPAVVLLVPMTREDLFDRIEEHGIDMAVGKPVIQSVLFNAIQQIFKLKAVASVGGGEPDKKEQQVKKMEKEGKTILVVEDNKTNQLIARSLLEHEGYNVILADDGQKGVEAFTENREKISLILMDLHMPVLDGFEASRKIRQESGDVPIIALTADVIDGVREKCGRFGILDYISKPFDPEHFLEAVEKVLESGAASPSMKGSEILDRSLGMKYLGNNEALYEAVIAEYRRENSDTAERLTAAVRSGNYSEAAQIAHKVKSSSGSIGATQLFETARDLQHALEDGNEEVTTELHDRFCSLMEKLLAEIGQEE